MTPITVLDRASCALDNRRVHTPRLSRIRSEFHTGAPSDKPLDTIWKAAREQGEDRGGVEPPDQYRTLDSGRVHHRAHILNAFGQRRDTSNLVRQTRAALIECDNATERRQTLEEPRELGEFPHDFHMRNPTRYPHQIDRTPPEDLVHDVHAPSASETGLRNQHQPILTDPQPPGRCRRRNSPAFGSRFAAMTERHGTIAGPAT